MYIPHRAQGRFDMRGAENRINANVVKINGTGVRKNMTFLYQNPWGTFVPHALA
jgi:hypothetical protein